MIVKDHFLTGESFEIKKVSKGVLTTLPKTNTHDLRRYYDSKNYYSHSSSKSVLSILYDLSSRFMVFRKTKLVSRLLKDKKISEDENKVFEKDIQKNTDDNIEKIDKILAEKEKEILNL